MHFTVMQNVNKKLKLLSPPLDRSDGSLTTCNQESANVLVSFFKQLLLLKIQVVYLPSFSNRLDHHYLSDVHISEEIVFHKLSNLKPFKSPGPDSYVLKACADCLAKPPCILYQQSLVAGLIPNIER